MLSFASSRLPNGPRFDVGTPWADLELAPRTLQLASNMAFPGRRYRSHGECAVQNAHLALALAIATKLTLPAAATSPFR